MKKIYILSLIALFSATGVSAQIQSMYFLDNYTYSYRSNPANMTDKSFVGVGFSNIEAGMGSGIGLSSILYPAPGGNGLVTGFNSGISSEEFLSGIQDENTFQGNFNLNIFSLGLHRKNTMTTVELNSKTFMDGTISGDLFRFLKVGGENSTYDFSSTALNAKSYIELAVGRTRRVSGTMSFGYRVKGLMGVAGAYANLENSQASLSGSQIGVNLKGTAGVAGGLVQFKTDADGKVSGVEGGSGFSPAGFGAAIDAGISWKPVDGLTLSASIADLGLISWKYDSMAEANNSVNYNGVDLSGKNAEIDDELDKVMDDFKDLANFRKKSGEESSSDLLPFRINAAARYQIPNVKSLSAGVLFTYQNSVLPVIDVRAAVTYTPKKWFSVTGNVGGGSFGMVWGGALSLCSSAANFYFGLDAYIGPISSDLIPVNKFNCKLNLGLVFRFGK
jgi:hypothetical protein